MSKLDQFESVFKSASREPFRYQKLSFKKILLFTDVEEYPSRLFCDGVRAYLKVLDAENELAWTTVGKGEYEDVKDLLGHVERVRPDLIIAYRNLGIGAASWPFSLGVHLDVLTQVTSTPVLVLPNPTHTGEVPELPNNTDSVMVIADHLAGAHTLVNYGVAFTQKSGRLMLTHVEDDKVFERYLEAISKISAIDTDVAREQIQRQLLKDARDYVTSCAEVLKRESLSVQIEEIVTLGHRVTDYKELIAQHEVDLLIFNTKDDDQLAMHGLAYPLAVELRETPLLML